jgi:transcriptional regulator with XRE-family HTH domain/Zn-dependent peptidase ImmA (M78 family)
MALTKQHIRLIFGLKVRQLRQQKGLSFAELSKLSGLSVSYLNEIEKGKKYPKSGKIIHLAGALGTSYDQLVSLKLSKKLAPISELLSSGFLESLPLELFGLETSTLLELISSAPSKINAFISSILKIARSYEMKRENFYFAALRSFQEMHDNYFEEMENEVDRFRDKFGVEHQPTADLEHLQGILTGEFEVILDETRLGDFAHLKHFRSVFDPDTNTLYVNPNLSSTQKAFLLGRELAFHFLEMRERPLTSNLFAVHSFEEVLNNFRASYFAVALLINRHLLVGELSDFFQRTEWDGEAFMNLIYRYGASPEMFLTRMTSLLPTHFGVDQLFFLRFKDSLKMPAHSFHINKELHISRQHNPHRNDLNEHYCRRWVSIRILQELRDNGTTLPPREYKVAVQRSRYIGTKSEYFCISIARHNDPTPDVNVSVTLGILVDRNTRKRIRFLAQPDVPQNEVNETCERCALTDCAERAAPPLVVEGKVRKEIIRKEIAALVGREPEMVE